MMITYLLINLTIGLIESYIFFKVSKRNLWLGKLIIVWLSWKLGFFSGKSDPRLILSCVTRRWKRWWLWRRLQWVDRRDVWWAAERLSAPLGADAQWTGRGGSQQGLLSAQPNGQGTDSPGHVQVPWWVKNTTYWLMEAVHTGSRTTPHHIKIKLTYCPPGPWSRGHLPNQGHYKPVKPLIRTNTYMVGNCHGGKLSGDGKKHHILTDVNCPHRPLLR